MNYEIAGSFSVDAENIKIEAYVVPNAGKINRKIEYNRNKR